MHTADDQTLLLKTHAGDEAAARELWSRHAGRLRAYALAILPSWLSADDAVQAVMCRILSTDRARLRTVADPAAWMMRGIRNEALTMMRTARRERRRRETLETTRQATLAPTHAGACGDLQSALAELPRRMREIVVLRHVSGLTFDQAAAALEANRHTVAWRYREAMARLRQLLGAETGPGEDAPSREVSHA